MIDVIIPIYNFNENILKTLFSVCVQTIKDKIKVYLIDNNLDKKNEYLVDLFNSELDIEIIYTENGNVFLNEGIKYSKNPYIFFLFPGQRLYYGYSLEILLKSIELNDIAYGIEVIKSNEKICIYDDNFRNSINAKLYKREFLEKNNIYFTNVEQYSDVFFNKFTFAVEPNFVFCEEYIIFTENLKKDDIFNFNNYIVNAEILINEYIKRNFEENIIAREIIEIIIYLYFEFLRNTGCIEKNKLFNLMKNIAKLNYIYMNFISLKKIEDIYLFYYNKYNIVIPEITLKEFIKLGFE